MIATKEQELKALARIKKIVEELGENSYTGMAFEGCFEIAEENIENDFGCSMKQSLESARAAQMQAHEKVMELKKELEAAERTIEQLKAQVEREQEWKPYEDTDNVSQADYERLTAQGDTEYLSDDKAKDLLYDWYGFAREKVTIYHSIPKYEVNRHHTLRKVGEIDRRPAYNATDWNYIRFDCGAMAYELYNDTLRFYIH